jgi:hypothetical protein
LWPRCVYGGSWCCRSRAPIRVAFFARGSSYSTSWGRGACAGSARSRCVACAASKVFIAAFFLCLLPGLSGSTRLPHRWRMRDRRLPTTRPTSRDLQEPSYPRKKCVIWTRWRPVPVKNVNYLRAPSNRLSGLFGPYTTPPIVNYEYMTSTRREGYFGPPTLGT